ncbi:MAG: hypothetical protein A2Y65_08510 [Deltaproteobacteria bacterium RBG_13_52_11]|nr:MAG: hypothetical protein A2Y65_08510 [Deltaproteobacteria bacterium RBG_13_52_11]
MKIWIKALKGFGYVWLALICILIFIGIVGVWRESGFSGVLKLLSPFNLWNWLATIITLIPAIGAFMLAEKLQSKMKHSST